MHYKNRNVYLVRSPSSLHFIQVFLKILHRTIAEHLPSHCLFDNAEFLIGYVMPLFLNFIKVNNIFWRLVIFLPCINDSVWLNEWFDKLIKSWIMANEQKVIWICSADYEYALYLIGHTLKYRFWQFKIGKIRILKLWYMHSGHYFWYK